MPKSGSEKNDEYKYGCIQVIHVETKIKGSGSLNICVNDFNTWVIMILEMVYKQEVHNFYIF